MPLDFRNTNTLWASIMVETLDKLGLNTAVICPGSRSTPLTVAFAQNRNIEALPVLDERSAAFFALGRAKQSGLPVVLVCTSGTAGANFYPAIIEAKQSYVPLLVFTADRPPELRECHAGQTIDQIRLYGDYPNWQAELAIPSAEIGMLRYVRQTIIHAWNRAISPYPGVVHLNMPFRDPLAPIPQAEIQSLQATFPEAEFFAGITPQWQENNEDILRSNFDSLIQDWQQYQEGIIIAGVAQPHDAKSYCQAVGKLSQYLGFPVLAEGLSPLRNNAQDNPYLITTYDLILRNRKLAQQLKPKLVIQLGALPTSKELRAWLNMTQAPCWLIHPSTENFDPLHRKTTHLQIAIEHLVKQFSINIAPAGDYLHLWQQAETNVRETVNQTMFSLENLVESKVAWLISRNLPEKTPIFIANSMPVRDVEFFWQPSDSQVMPYFNRGANGIDGTLSTALGIAHHQKSSVLLTGDLALLHDTNGFLLSKKFSGHLTIILINNRGGGIFEMLPIAKFEPPFEEYFATPQEIYFADLCTTYGMEYISITSWEQLAQKLNPLPKQGIRILEIATNRRADAQWRQEHLAKFAQMNHQQSTMNK